MIILTSELRVRVAIIDEQHQELIDLINYFETIEKDTHTTDDIEKALDFLGEYIVKHFTFEEGLMIESGYPDYSWHKNWHQSYILKFNSLKEEYHQNGITDEFVYILNEFIVKWIVRHIKNVDVNFGKFYNEHKK